jgi:hypothetical protein
MSTIVEMEVEEVLVDVFWIWKRGNNETWYDLRIVELAYNNHHYLHILKIMR